ncbi:hypothetical protein [Siphonobacter sp.]|uniref:hypothetical protein n=1 Tax=Siphonobacter sp. TaxID=1869184 RepID=UPI003B3A0069
MKKILLILAIAVCFTACRSGRSSGVKTSQKAGYTFSDYDLARKAPDHLRTLEQKTMLIQLIKIVADHMVVEQNQLVFKMSEEAFVRKGMPKELYAEIQQNMETNNKYLATMEPSEIDLDEMLKNFKASMNKLSSSAN